MKENIKPYPGVSGNVKSVDYPTMDERGLPPKK